MSLDRYSYMQVKPYAAENFWVENKYKEIYNANESNKILCDGHLCVQIYFSLAHSHTYCYSYIKWNCKLIGNGCSWPHYVIKFIDLEGSSGVLQGIYLFYWGLSLYSPTQGTITLVCEYHSLLSDSQQGSHHCFTTALSAAWEANTGQRKQGAIPRMTLSEETYTCKATACSRAFLFT